MGNLMPASSSSKTPKPTNNEKEMMEPQTISYRKVSLLTLDEVSDMCVKLEENVNSMSLSIDSVIFGEGDSNNIIDKTSPNSSKRSRTSNAKGAVFFDEEEEVDEEGSSEDRLESKMDDSESDEQTETKFLGMARLIQNLISEITDQLDQHSKQVTCSSGDNNAQLMTCVFSLVNNVNNYMTMLIKNIRKLGRAMSEGDPNMRSVRQRLKGEDPKMLEVIKVTQDVDAMLMELRGTEKQREDLERDVIDVMLICKHYRGIQKAQEECLTSIEMNVKLAALSIERGHSRKLKKF